MGTVWRGLLVQSARAPVQLVQEFGEERLGDVTAKGVCDVQLVELLLEVVVEELETACRASCAGEAGVVRAQLRAKQAECLAMKGRDQRGGIHVGGREGGKSNSKVRCNAGPILATVA